MKKQIKWICAILCAVMIVTPIGANAATYTPNFSKKEYSTHKVGFTVTYSVTGSQVKSSVDVYTLKGTSTYAYVSVSQVEDSSKTATALWYDSSRVYKGYKNFKGTITIGGNGYTTVQ